MNLIGEPKRYNYPQHLTKSRDVEDLDGREQYIHVCPNKSHCTIRETLDLAIDPIPMACWICPGVRHITGCIEIGDWSDQ